MEERQEVNDLGYVVGEKSRTSYLTNISNIHFNFEPPDLSVFEKHLVNKCNEEHPNELLSKCDYLDAVAKIYVGKKK